MCIFHDWGRWEEYQEPVPDRILSSRRMIIGAIKHRQKRHCKRCGKVQDKQIRIQAI